MIELAFCRFERFNWGCQTTFPYGTIIEAFPHWDDHHYHVISHRCGYGDDLLAYCQEHEFVHSFLAEKLNRAESNVLWLLARGDEPTPQEAAYEEALVQMFQLWLRGHQRPIIGGIDWGALKAEALELLAQ